MNIRTQIKIAIQTLMETVVFSAPINGYSTWANVIGEKRRLKMFNKIDPTMQPALYITQHRESYENRGMGTPATRIMFVQLWAFAPTADEDIDGDDLLDIMTDGIESVMDNPDNALQNELTFGGLCAYCKIDQRSGLYIRDPGDIDGQALLVLPLRIMLP